MFRLLSVTLKQARVHNWVAVRSRIGDEPATWRWMARRAARAVDPPPAPPAGNGITCFGSSVLVTAEYLKLLLGNCQTQSGARRVLRKRSHFCHRRGHHAGTRDRPGGDPHGAADA